jgi:hypothetical protein
MEISFGSTSTRWSSHHQSSRHFEINNLHHPYTRLCTRCKTSSLSAPHLHQTPLHQQIVNASPPHLVIDITTALTPFHSALATDITVALHAGKVTTASFACVGPRVRVAQRKRRARRTDA